MGGLAAAAAVALAVAGGALAAKEKVRLDAADQALARGAVLKQADLGPASAWTGGASKPDLTSQPVCADYHPKQSDLVITGAAASSFTATSLGLDISSQTTVLETARMVALDWKQSVEPPAAAGCVGTWLTKGAGVDAKLVSASRFGFPKVAPLTAGFRYLIDIGKPGSVRYLIVDIVLTGKGRAEVDLTTIGFMGLSKPSAAAEAGAERTLTADEAQLARTLLARTTPAHPSAA